ncbi:unnamed protein product [Caenorhabditis auriculariae]|uniref:Aquaporin n=1 Tax=Caenorhabditis auriculariae TaxID=2777116 RepID=A0A8S1H8S0_9PELO|nr:unnamed protein product [Caenorhabditis auriculariae]
MDVFHGTLDQPHLYPLYTAISFYAAVFVIGEISRVLVDKFITRRGSSHDFLIELIGTIQMCTCVYENGIIVKHYGLNGFFVVVGLLLTAGGVFNRGAFTNCLPIIEEFWYNRISSSRLLTLISAQLIGATFASKVAYTIWNNTSQYSNAHLENARNTQCILNYHQPAGTVIAFEVIGAATMRFVCGYLASSPKLRKLIPFAVSLYLTLALYVIGVPGLNPIVATSRLFGCQGIDNQSFFLLYWICPIVGWMLGAALFRADGNLSVKPKSSGKKKRN